MLERRKMAEAIRQAAEDAGSLVAAALGISLVALVLAGIAMIFAVRARRS